MAWNFSNGLLGLGGFGGGQQNMPMNALLGEFYDPAEMRKQQFKQMLLGMGAGLLSEKGLGRGATMALAAGDLAGRNYRDNAMEAYKMKTAADDRAFDRQWNIDERNYRRGRDKQADEEAKKASDWQDYLRKQEIDKNNRDTAIRNGQMDAVEGFNSELEGQGGNLFSPRMQSWLRTQGVAGVDPTDTQRYNNMQPYVQAGDYNNAFQQMTAKPDVPQGYTLAPGAVRFDGYNNPVAAGQPKTPDTVINNGPNEPSDAGLRKKLSDKEGETWNLYQQGADVSGGMMQDLQVLDELSKIAPQGPITGRAAQMFPGFSSAGAAYQSIISRVAPSLRSPGSGSTSDVEYNGFLNSLPSLQNTPEGNAVISAILQRKAQINIERGDIVNRYQNGEISAVEARKQLGALNRRSILDPSMKKLIDAAGGGQPHIDDVVSKWTNTNGNP